MIIGGTWRNRWQGSASSLAEMQSYGRPYPGSPSERWCPPHGDGRSLWWSLLHDEAQHSYHKYPAAEKHSPKLLDVVMEDRWLIHMYIISHGRENIMYQIYFFIHIKHSTWIACLTLEQGTLNLNQHTLLTQWELGVWSRFLFLPSNWLSWTLVWNHQNQIWLILE